MKQQGRLLIWVSICNLLQFIRVKCSLCSGNQVHMDSKYHSHKMVAKLKFKRTVLSI